MLPTRLDILKLAWPIVLAQVATAASGIVDTAVMSRTGDRFELAAVAVASVAFTLLYWAFGFLRMSTTSLTAIAVGAGNEAEARAVLVRSLLLGGGLGLALMALHPVFRFATVALFDVEAAAAPGLLGYLDARIFGAPAALTGFALNGWLLGRGRTRALLGFQIALNGTNAVLDTLFVTAFDLGPTGIGLGTAIAEWVSLAVGLWLVRDGFRAPAVILDRARLTALFSSNRDVMIRTVSLLAGIVWFTQSGTRLGSEVVGGNDILMQLIAVSAFVLDSFAFLTEKEAGESAGARDLSRLKGVMRRTTELAVGFGALFVAFYALVMPPVLAGWVSDPAARDVALTYLPWCAWVPLLGVPAWQLDGLFLGAGQGRALRNAAVASTATYIGLDLLLRPYGADGLWTAFVAGYLLRAFYLGLYLPSLARDLRSQPIAPGAQA